MSYNQPPPYAAPPPLPGQGPRPPRPTTVTAAAAALVGEAVLLLISAAVSLLSADTLQKATDDYLEAQNLTANSSGNVTASRVFGIAFGLIFAAAFIGLALGVLRGSNVARIITWVLCGLALCCFGFSVISLIAVLAEYLPGGYLAYTYLFTALEFIGLIAAIVLLALPASNAYFRKPKQGF